MKKALAILSVLALTACGNGSNKETSTDSTAVNVDSAAVNLDSTAVSATDSTVAEIPAEGTEIK
jgi:hypothetical protein